jgi:DNA mismatch endonuclease (patch repair protein)
MELADGVKLFPKSFNFSKIIRDFMDTLSKAKRSWNMGLIKSRNTKPEMIFRTLLFKAGYRYRLHDKNLIGKPDLVLKSYKTVIFVNGCFWHGHKNCKRGNIPKSNNLYWDKKLAGNIHRDKLKVRNLKKLGWNVFVVWECELKNTIKVLNKFEKFIKNIEVSV